MSWWLSGGGGQGNVHFTNKAYLVKLSMKGEGGQKSPKNGPHGLCMAPYPGRNKEGEKEPLFLETFPVL